MKTLSHNSSTTAYERILHKQERSNQSSLYNRKKSLGGSKYTYSSPSKTKLSQYYVVENDPKSSYTDKEVSCFLSCIIQLKDHINYINILAMNLLEALSLMKTDLNGKFNEYIHKDFNQEKIENDKFEFDARFKSILNILDESLYKNTEAITQFSVITGCEKPGTLFSTSKLKKMLKLRNNNESIDSDDMDAPVPMERGILRQENICLKFIMKKYKEKKNEYKIKAEKYEVEIKGINKMRKTYENKIMEVRCEKEKISNDLELQANKLY